MARVAKEFVRTGPTPDALLALAGAGRGAGRPRVPEPVVEPAESGARRGHLRVLRGEG